MELLKPIPTLPELGDHMTEREVQEALEAAVTVVRALRLKEADAKKRFDEEIERLKLARDEATGDLTMKLGAAEAYLKHIMQLHGLKSYQAIDGRVQLRPSKAVDWDSSINPPKEYQRLKRELDKKLLNAAIKSGELMVTDGGKVVTPDGEILAGITIVGRDSLSVRTPGR